MSLIQWDPSFSVNVEILDEQHKLLVQLINDLYKAKNNGHQQAELEKIIERLSSYAAFHFAREEHYFDLFDYPQTEAHEKQHLDFEKKIKNFETDFKAGRQSLSNKVIQFLCDWLISHIKVSDKKYVSFLNERGVK